MIRFTYYSLYFILMISACRTPQELIYFQGLEEQLQTDSLRLKQIVGQTEIQIQYNDILEIRVSSFDPRAVAPFMNQGINAEGNTNENTAISGYLVDVSGAIDFPVLGKITLRGLTIREAEELLRTELENYVKSPVVDVRLQNFQVTVLGEINNPGVYRFPNENVTVLQVLGMAGDISQVGNRTNLLIIREEGEERTFARINMLTAEVFSSPFYYLQQNDIVYVEPDPFAVKQENRENVRSQLTIVTAITAFVTLVLTLTGL